MSDILTPAARIFVAGHRGLAGSAIVRRLHARGCTNLLLRSRHELDLLDASAVEAFFQHERPEFVFLAAAKVGGILANRDYPADFIVENLRIQTNVLESARRASIRRLLFLGSSCIYPKRAPQPLREEYLLTGPLEFTNRPYAVAKIAGIEICWAFNRQYGTHFLSAMPTNLYGPGDDYDLDASHVLPALIRKVHEAKEAGASEVIVWGTGKPLREFLYSDDMAEACVHLLNLPEKEFTKIAHSDEHPPLINVGSGSELSIEDLAYMICRNLGFSGRVYFDSSRPDGTPRKLMDSSRLFALGWCPRISLEEGIDHAYKDFLARLQAGTL